MDRPGSIVIERDVACTVRDGTTLRGDLYHPSDSGRLPTLVCRTPYGKHDPWLGGVATELARRGYLVVLQDHRGRHASDGVFRWMWAADRLSIGDDLDGYDTVEWAARLPGSNGDVGAFGHSNDGWSVFTMLSARPPSIRVAAVGGMSPNARDFTFGLFETGRRLQWVYEMAADDRRRRGLSGPQTFAEATHRWQTVERGKYLWWLPLATIPDDVFVGLTDAYRALVRAPHAEWLHLGDIHPRVDVPMLFITGWWDRLVDTVEHYTGLVQAGPPEVAALHRVIVGPWGHDPTRYERSLGPVDHGPDADADYGTLLGEWFDLHLKSTDPGNLAARPPVSTFILGEDRWHESESWPPSGVIPTAFYLASRGPANASMGAGELQFDQPGSEGTATDTFTYDPRDPVMSLLDVDAQVVPLDQRPRDSRPDVLVYETRALKEAITFIGPVELVLWAASDAPDTDWMATLAIVHQDGLAVNLTYGACRARFRLGFDQPTLLTPGEPVEYTIRMHPIGCTVSIGERLRLYVSSSDFPLFDRNHNTGRDDMSDSELRVAHQVVFHTPEMPSRINLPLATPAE